jgi:Flp pilus assembly protein TadD
MEERAVFPEASEEILHHFAYSCYQQGHFDKAINTFRLLTMFCPQNGGYWYGLGSSLMLKGNIEEARRAFQIASIHSPNDPRPFAYWAECAARQGDRDVADRIIAQAEEKAKQPQFTSFQEQIEVIKERVIQEVANG